MRAWCFFFSFTSSTRSSTEPPGGSKTRTITHRSHITLHTSHFTYKSHTLPCIVTHRSPITLHTSHTNLTHYLVLLHTGHSSHKPHISPCIVTHRSHITMHTSHTNLKHQLEQSRCGYTSHNKLHTSTWIVTHRAHITLHTSLSNLTHNTWKCQTVCTLYKSNDQFSQFTFAKKSHNYPTRHISLPIHVWNLHKDINNKKSLLFSLLQPSTLTDLYLFSVKIS